MGNRFPTVATLCLIASLFGNVRATSTYLTDLLSLRAADSSYAIPVTGNGLTTDLLDGEDIACPGVGDSIFIGGTPYVWTRVVDTNGVWADEPGKEDFVAYWSLGVHCSQKQDVRIRYRHDDGMRIWVFGALVVDEPAPDSGIEHTSPTIHLRAGDTRLLFKLSQGAGAAYFAAGLVDTLGASVSGKVIPTFSPGGISSEGVITVLSPKQGDVYHVGDTLAIGWVVDPRRLRQGVAPSLSVDNGLSWLSFGLSAAIQHGDEEYYSGDTGTYSWKISQELADELGSPVKVMSDVCRVRVWSEYDPNQPEGVTGLFRILADSSAVRPGLAVAQGRPFEIAPDGSGGVVVRVNSFNICRLRLLDAGGRTVATHVGRGRQRLVLSRNGAAAGVYILHLMVDGRASRTRILLQ